MIARRVSGCLIGVLTACGDAGGAMDPSGSTSAGTSEASFPGSTSAAPTSTSGAPTTGAATSGSEATSDPSTGGGSTSTGTTSGSTGSTSTGSTSGTESSSETGSTSGTGTTGTGSSTETGSSSETSGETSGETGSSSETGGGVCGDGVVDAGELCDDGDQDDDDECGNDCVLPTCGDGQQNGGETAIDCGGPDCAACPFALLLGGNASKAVGAVFDGVGWTSSDIAAPTVDGVGLAIAGDATGIGVLRYTKIGDPKDNQLQYVTWKAGVWSLPAQIGMDTTRAAPTISAVGTGAHVVFHGDNFQHYYAAYDGIGWAPAAEVIGSFGPGPGAVTTLGISALFVFHDGAQNNRLTARRRDANWLMGQVIDDDVQMFDRQPAIVALAADEALAVHVRNAGGQLRWSVGAPAWAAPADVAGAQTTSTPALAAVGAGEAALAFRGTDGKLYVARFDGADWQAPAPVANPNPSIFGPPALARGVGAAELELVYLDAGTKTIRHTRLIGGVWSAPVQVGNTALERVAIARGP